MTIPLTEQLKEVRREIALRRRVYPRWLSENKGGMTQKSADYKIACMEAVAETLAELARKEELPL